MVQSIQSSYLKKRNGYLLMIDSLNMASKIRILEFFFYPKIVELFVLSGYNVNEAFGTCQSYRRRETCNSLLKSGRRCYEILTPMTFKVYRCLTLSCLVPKGRSLIYNLMKRIYFRFIQR